MKYLREIIPLYACLLCLVWMASACHVKNALSENGEFAPAKPDSLLPKEKMIAILIDYHLAEAQCLDITGDQSVIEFVKKEQAIMEKHDIDSVHFRKSYEYYLQSLYEGQEIYNAVVDSFDIRNKALDTLNNKNGPPPVD